MHGSGSRRRVLVAGATTLCGVGLAGCLDGTAGDDSNGEDPNGDGGSNGDGDGSGSNEDDSHTGNAADDESTAPGDDSASVAETHPEACDAGASFLEVAFDGDFEAAADFYPAAYLDDYDRTDWVEYLTSRFDDAAATYELEAATCTEARTADEDAVVAEAVEELDATVEVALGLTYELEVDAEGETTTERIDVLAAEIDGEWYVGVVDEGSVT